MQKVDIKDIGGYVAKEDDRYVVKDNPSATLPFIKHFSTSRKRNSGHKHEGQEEVYSCRW